METQSNPVLTPLIRVVLCVTMLANLRVASLFFMPDYRPDWLWQIGPFNAYFLGAIYLAEIFGLGVLLLVNRWSPGRMVLTMLLAFTAPILVVTLLNLDKLRMDSWFGWLWLFIYIGEVVLSVYLLWRYRKMQPALAVSPGRVWRGFLMAQGVIVGLYGLGLLVAPLTFTGFWPWRIDAFHGQLYSGLFIMLAVGAFVLARAESRLELLALGLVQVTLGPLAIAGLLMAEVGQRRVDWSQAGTWVWVGGCGLLAVMGAGMLWQAYASFRGAEVSRKVSYV